MKLKAYRVDNPGSWSTLVYAETASKAKMIDFREYHDGDFEDVLAMRVVRVPQCDGFAGDEPSIDDDPRHQAMVDMLVECGWCGMELGYYDEITPLDCPMVLCEDCAVRYRAEDAA